MEDKFNKKAKQGWRFAADAPVHTNESASSVDCKHTSGGVSLAIDISFGSVVDKKRRSVHVCFLDIRYDSLKHTCLSEED